MYDKNKIMTGIVIFLIAVLFPVWFTIASGGAGDKVQPDLESALENLRKDPTKSHCVEDLEYMRAFHMDLLDSWRDEVVRQNDRVYESKAFEGEKYEKSLTKTCLMQCHSGPSRKVAFCDRCHNFADVRPNCWVCHVDPEMDAAMSKVGGE